MDPNEALKRARKATARIRELQDKDPEALTKEEAEEHEQEHENLVESFEALDGWLSNGGFLPTGWKAGR